MQHERGTLGFALTARLEVAVDKLIALAKREMEDEARDLRPLFELILKHVPEPAGDAAAPLKVQVAMLSATLVNVAPRFNPAARRWSSQCL